MKDRITVQEAARRLGVKDDAIRKRIQRGTLEHDKDPDGRVFVYLDATQHGTYDSYKDGAATQDSSYPVGYDMLLSSQQEQIEFLRRELERKDAIIMSLTQRIPELEPPKEASREPRESPVSAQEAASSTPGTPEEEKPETRPPWWRRLFGP